MADREQLRPFRGAVYLTCPAPVRRRPSKSLGRVLAGTWAMPAARCEASIHARISQSLLDSEGDAVFIGDEFCPACLTPSTHGDLGAAGRPGTSTGAAPSACQIRAFAAADQRLRNIRPLRIWTGRQLRCPTGAGNARASCPSMPGPAGRAANSVIRDAGSCWNSKPTQRRTERRAIAEGQSGIRNHYGMLNRRRPFWIWRRRPSTPTRIEAVARGHYTLQTVPHVRQ